MKKSHETPSVDELFSLIRKGELSALSRSITLVEGSLAAQREKAGELLKKCIPHSGNSVRIGITGIPGAGKSTFIEAIGQYFLNAGHKLAVLAVDPSSRMSRGSILGDKTRMEKLSGNPDVFIRPSPSGTELGGVARSTRESMIICEAAGYDVILVETVGVGQSEVAVHSMVDLFLLLAIPGAGDELQGIKRGIMEMADLVVINKAEGDNLKKAKAAARHLENALHLFPPHRYGHTVDVLQCAALSGLGMEDVHDSIQKLITFLKENSSFDERRSEQSVYWLKESIDSGLKEMFYELPEVKSMYSKLETDVSEGKISSFDAAAELLSIFKNREH